MLPKYRPGDKGTQGLVSTWCGRRGKQLGGNIGKHPPEIFLVRVWAKHEELAALQVVFPMAQEHVGPTDVGTGDPVRCHSCGFSCPGHSLGVQSFLEPMPRRCQSPWQELSPSSSTFSFPPWCSWSRASSSGGEGSINHAALSPGTAAAQPDVGRTWSGMNPSLPSKGQALSSRLSSDLVPTKAESPLKQSLGSQMLYK